MTDETLKPCPHCGKEAYIFTEDDSHYSLKPKTMYSVSCTNCENWFYSKQKAIDRWNMRT